MMTRSIDYGIDDLPLRLYYSFYIIRSWLHKWDLKLFHSKTTKT